MGPPPRQAVSWIGTIPLASWLDRAPRILTDPLPQPLVFIRGQHERGESGSGYEHAQLVAHFATKQSLAAVISHLGPGHWEPTKSAAADAYVWKDGTALPGTRFELGHRPLRRNCKKDWDAIWTSALVGDLTSIPSSVRVQSYRTLKCIAADHMVPQALDRSCFVFWGRTGTGKSRGAWEAAGLLAYPKDPRSKFWCGYRDHRSVVIDEFRGGIDIGHILRWLDRYPVIVEVKGGAVPFCATQIWITSNLHPRDWYPELDPSTLEALLRRLNITEYL